MLTTPGVGEISEYLRPFDFFERYVHGRTEGEVYVDTHAARFGETLAWLPQLPDGARALELGAVPYYMTILLQKFGGLRVDRRQLLRGRTRAGYRARRLE